MKSAFSHEVVDRPLVVLVAEPEGLALSLLEKLLANFCCVNVYTENVSLWREASYQLRNNKYFKVLSLEDLEKEKTADYLVFVSLYYFYFI